MRDSQNKSWEATKMALLVCILGLQGFWLWEEVIQPKRIVVSLKSPLQTAVRECAQERDYQRRVGATLEELHGRTSGYLRRSFVISSAPCRQEEVLGLELLANNVSQAEVDLIKRTADMRGF